MRGASRIRIASATLLALAGLAHVLPTAASAKPVRHLSLGLVDDPVFGSSNAGERRNYVEKAQEARASIVRVSVSWAEVAPSRPLNAANPDDPAYRFGALDRVVAEVAGRGLEVMLTISAAPPWAEGPSRPTDAPRGSWRPDPVAFASFSQAVARRYSGGHRPPSNLLEAPRPLLPRIRYYQAWNEPNLSEFLGPQAEAGRAASVEIYRGLLNRLHDAVKAVRADNVVVAAGTAPFGDEPGGNRIRPLEFWRRLLCVDVSGAASSCPEPARFDILAHHPINTVGGPRDGALDPNDLTIPDMRRLRQVLRGAERLGTIAPTRHRLWATELWWETNPPDPSGIPLARQARWIEESFYELWRQGVSAVFVLGIRDAHYSGHPGRPEMQSGLFFANGEPKPSYTAFRFPLVATRLSKRRALIWTIPPERGRVRIQRRTASGWRSVGGRRGRPGRIIKLRLDAPRRARFRARVGSSQSLPHRVRKRRG